MISKKELKKIVTYNHETGEFFWKKRPETMFSCRAIYKNWNSRHSGKIAGGMDNKGYIRIRVGTKKYRAHRLAWLYMTGEWPKDQVDHINGIRHDNRWVNLREAGSADNAKNRRINNNNTTGYRGVSVLLGKYVANIGVDGKKKYLGWFNTPEEASAAYRSASKKYHGEFSNI